MLRKKHHHDAEQGDGGEGSQELVRKQPLANNGQHRILGAPYLPGGSASRQRRGKFVQNLFGAFQFRYSMRTAPVPTV